MWPEPIPQRDKFYGSHHNYAAEEDIRFREASPSSVRRRRRHVPTSASVLLIASCFPEALPKTASWVRFSLLAWIFFFFLLFFF